MASTVPLEVIEDDDDFDWDAAVRAIDAACGEATIPSSSGVTTTSATIYGKTNLHSDSCPKTENNKPASSRQSTLDRFIGLTCSKSTNQDVRHDAQNKVENDDEIASDVSIDPEAAKTWIYPENISVRDYQASITRTALFSNTLVCLPTGLGKTFIAAVVMYNYYRWFPQGKIVFAAPSRPLVLQQIKACHNIVGIPQEYTVDMTGQTTPSKRAGLWKTKRIFFLTPQVLEKDIETGKCEMKELVCLVLDEAHRASGNYAYCVAVRKLMAVPVQLRLLALTATPGSKLEKVQQVIDNLQISSLEHRSESDPEVAPYVHHKDVELIQVEMGKYADEVNDLLLDVMRRFHSRLSNMGVHLKSNVNTLSPNTFLESREKFRQAPPQNLPISGHGEVEGIFAVLIALYHIKKLLSGYGITPTSEALEEKLKQRSFARFMSNNESLWKAKVIMQQFVSRGDRSPKSLKMLEVLVDHFKKQDSQKSRVIIFSNYRGSVREIMDSLATIGPYVKATEFIGQNSGKTSKGQSQKVQQAVLEKFRAGGYNVIVATSIGEEGLDIMEVDLVICYDANVSSLRMVQRMGRTGRKNKGRVVVLACEGAELEGYKRKQAGGKAIRKRMMNGGTNSFRFHSSPRMVPRMFRPEKVLVKLLIEKYVENHGKKVKNDGDAIQTPKYKLKLTDMETDLLAKFFQSPSENDWRPSLIAFPYFQAFPSRVHKVAHSTTTGMLIDTMQNLQDLCFNDRDEETSEGYLKVETIEHHDSSIKEDDPIQKEAESDIILSPMKHGSPHVHSHSFLFGSEFTSVDSLGRVTILSVPSFPLTKCTSPQNMSDISPARISHSETAASDINVVFTTPVKSQGNDDPVESSTRNATETPHADLSPRLTNILMSGVVPESPIAIGTSSMEKGNPTTPDHVVQPDTSMHLDQSKQNEGGIEIESPKCVTKLSDDINDSCSKDWMLSSGEKSVSQPQPKPRLKRLRRYGDVEAIVGPTTSSCAPLEHLSNKRGRGDKKVLNDARIFIDNEAEVSSEGSGDEDVDQGQEDSYDDSFIDDRINPTVASTHAESDMMAIYRRSLLTQSPAIRTPQFPVYHSPNTNNTLTDQMHDGGSTSGTRTTNRTHTNNYSTSSVSFNTEKLISDAGIPSATDTGIRKRKLSFSHQSLPIRNLEKEIIIEEAAKEEEEGMDDFDDFYQGIDFDALEEEATRQLRSRVEEEVPDKKVQEKPNHQILEVSDKIQQEQPNDQVLDFLDCPSFDLGF